MEREQLLVKIQTAKAINNELKSMIAQQIDNDGKLIKQLNLTIKQLQQENTKQTQQRERLMSEFATTRQLLENKDKDIDQIKKDTQHNIITMQEQLTKAQSAKIKVDKALREEKELTAKLYGDMQHLHKTIDGKTKDFAEESEQLKTKIKQQETLISQLKDQNKTAEQNFNERIIQLQKVQQAEQISFEQRLESIQKTSNTYQEKFSKQCEKMEETNKEFQEKQQHFSEFQISAKEKMEDQNDKIRSLQQQLNNANLTIKQLNIDLDFEKRRNQLLSAETEKERTIKKLQREIVQLKNNSAEQQSISASLLDQRNAQEILAKSLQRDLDELKSQCANDSNLQKIQNQEKRIKEYQAQIEDLRHQMTYYIDLHQQKAIQQSKSPHDDKASTYGRLGATLDELAQMEKTRRETTPRSKPGSAASYAGRSRGGSAGPKSITRSELRDSEIAFSYLNNSASSMRRSRQDELEASLALRNLAKSFLNAKVEHDNNNQLQTTNQLNQNGFDLEQQLRVSQQLLERNEELEKQVWKLKYEAAQARKDLHLMRSGAK